MHVSQIVELSLYAVYISIFVLMEFLNRNSSSCQFINGIINDFITIFMCFGFWFDSTMDENKCVYVSVLLLSIWWLKTVWQLVYGMHCMNHFFAICQADQVQQIPEMISNKCRNFHKNWFQLSIRRDVKVLETLNIEHTNRSQ